MKTPILRFARLPAPAPLDGFALVLLNGVLARLDFAETDQAALKARFGEGVQLEEGEAPAQIAEALQAWLEGDFAPAQALPVDLGGTPFQQRVWAALREIPPGEIRSYGAIADRLGLARGASRAVGAANGRNPVSLVVPCHRVIGASGALVGYGGGLPRKLWMLRHEGARGFSADLFEA